MVIQISLEFGSRALLVFFHSTLPSEGNLTLKQRQRSRLLSSLGGRKDQSDDHNRF